MISPQLLTFRDHARKQAEHTRGIATDAIDDLVRCTDPGMRRDLAACIDRALAEADLWTRLADEIDTNLPALEADDVTLFQEGLFA